MPYQTRPVTNLVSNRESKNYPFGENWHAFGFVQISFRVSPQIIGCSFLMAPIGVRKGRKYDAMLADHLMSFASGGILYLLIQDIIPESKLDENCLTSLGVTLGFLVGIIGEKEM